MLNPVVAACLAASLLYENDFSSRTSTDLPPGADWAVYTYDKGGPVAYDYEPTSTFSYYTGPYPWSSASVYSQQDGWVKGNAGNTQNNRGRTSVSDEDDPALVFSDKNLSTGDATNHDITVYHTLRNVFTNGVLRAQFDIRQVSGYTASKVLSWFRFMYDKNVMNRSQLGSFPIELGLSSNTLSGGWRVDGQKDGERTFFSSNNAGHFGEKGFRPEGLHWYRYYMTCDLDAMTSSFEVYDLGTERIPMDSHPAGEPLGHRENLLFRKNLDTTTGGISCFAIRTGFCDTLGYYGEAGFNEGYAYKYDNIKIDWKAPGASAFVDCYRNDFTKSQRRVVTGDVGLSHTYALKAMTDSSTFTYPASLVRPASDYTQLGKPYLPARFGTANTVQTVGVDGWRHAGNSGYTGVIAVTTNGANRVAILTKHAMVMQPMCADVSNGVVRFEYDVRMPKTWNNGSTYVPLSLISNKGYDEEYNIMNNFSLLRIGPCSSTGAKDGSHSFITSTQTGLWGSIHSEWNDKFTALNWYRAQVYVNLDTAKYQLFVYDLGTSAPAKPENYDSSDTNKAIVASAVYDLYNPTDASKNPQVKYGKAIGAYGFTSWNDGSSDADCAIYVDNVRFWKQNGDSWTLLFQNDFSAAQRKNFTRKAIRINPSGYLDRPEHDEDFWSCMPTYNAATYVAGKDAMLDAGDNVFSVVHPLGRTIRNGKLTAQYDVRVPVFWNTSMNYFWLQLGGGMLASASTWTHPNYRYPGGRAIRTGIQMGMNATAGLTDDSTGVNNRTAIIACDGKPAGDGNDTTTKARHITGSYCGHWIRFKIEADVAMHTWSCTTYDMGTSHPTFATADGTQLDSWSGLRFSTHAPITHVHLIGGRNPSYAPWRDELPGALVVDNIRIGHDKSGLSVIVR